MLFNVFDKDILIINPDVFLNIARTESEISVNELDQHWLR